MIIFLRIEYAHFPVDAEDKRLFMKLYGDIFHISANFGYAEFKSEKKYTVYNDILILTKELDQLPVPESQRKVTFFISNPTISISKRDWRS
jgi:hypothetical protein